MVEQSPFHILITDRFHHESELKLRAQKTMILHHSQTPQPSSQELQKVQALIIRSRTQVNEKLLQQAPNLKVIVSATSGFDHIELTAAQNHGVVVMHTPDANTRSAAELTWALILACARHLTQAHRQVKAGLWRDSLALGCELNGKVLGIVGLGRVGSHVAKIALAFGMQVLAYDPYLEEAVFTQMNVARRSYEEVLKQSDVISFHVPKTKETHHMLNQNYFGIIMPNAILINTSRGDVIHETDLANALHEKRLAAIGLDVFENEPLTRHSALLRYENVVFTPHIGASTEEAFLRASDKASELVLNFLTTGTICHALVSNLK